MGDIIPGGLEPRIARLAALREKLPAREGRPGFKRNTQMLKAEIARLEAQDGQA